MLETSKAAQEFGFESKTDFREGLTETVHHNFLRITGMFSDPRR
jgi:hypothetical protein